MTVDLTGHRYQTPLVVCLYLALAAVPWLAGCSPWLATCLSGACLAGLPAAVRALPGPRGALRRIGFRDGAWTAWTADGLECPLRVLPGPRVLPGLVLCRVEAGGCRRDLWILRRNVPAPGFRRLAVALRCARADPAP